MSWIACCRKIDEQAEQISDLQGVVAQQLVDLAAAHKQIDVLTADLHKAQMKANTGLGPW